MAAPSSAYAQTPHAVPSTPQPGALDEALQLAAEQVLSDWALLTPRHAGVALDRPAAEHLHVSTGLGGARDGRLVLSTHPRFGAMLAVASTGDGHAGRYATEALLELTQRLGAALAGQGLAAQPLPAAALCALDALPPQAPQASLRLRVNGYPLELRLWLR